MKILTIKKALKNDEITYREFYSAIQEKGLGNWDNINSADTIQDYITYMMKQGVRVSHILEALEQNESEFDDWSIWLGNSMETPSPINSKQDLIDALGLDEDELKQKITINE